MLAVRVSCGECRTAGMDEARVVCECNTVDNDFLTAAGVALGSRHV